MPARFAASVPRHASESSVPLTAGRAVDADPRARRRFRGSQVRDELPPLHPRGVGEILDTAVDVLRRRFLTCVGLATALWIPVTWFDRAALNLDVVDDEALGTLFAMLFAGMGAQFVVQALAVALVTVLVYRQMQGHVVGARRTFRIVLPRLPALMLMTLVVNVFIFGGMMACLVPGILLSWLWMMAPAVLILERAGPLWAMRRSARLARGSFPRWLGMMVTQTALMIPFVAVSGLALTTAEVRDWLQGALGIGDGAYMLMDVGVSSLLSGVATAFSAVVLTVFYLDNRVRGEGFDLHMRLERIRENRLDDRDADRVEDFTPAEALA